MTNRFLGLQNGALAHSAIENMIADASIDMGDSVKLVLTPIDPNEIQPRIIKSTNVADTVYGIAIGGDNDGVYGDGSASTTDLTRATVQAGETVRLITRGRCPAKVSGVSSAVAIGDKLVPSVIDGVLEKIPTGLIRFVAAVSLNNVALGQQDIIVVEMVKEGFTSTS